MLAEENYQWVAGFFQKIVKNVGIFNSLTTLMIDSSYKLHIVLSELCLKVEMQQVLRDPKGKGFIFNCSAFIIYFSWNLTWPSHESS